MLVIYPAVVRQLNHQLEADLGSNPRYNWRWSEDLLHVMEVIDPDTAKIQLVESTSPTGLTVLSSKTEVRKLLPDHHEQWIMCAMVDVNERDGSFTGTQTGAWAPVSSASSGPVCLQHGEVPSQSTTDAVIKSVKEYRTQNFRDFEIGFEDRKRKQEKAHWNNVYDQIRDAGTAYQNVPGQKGHASFPNWKKDTPLVTLN